MSRPVIKHRLYSVAAVVVLACGGQSGTGAATADTTAIDQAAEQATPSETSAADTPAASTPTGPARPPSQASTRDTAAPIREGAPPATNPAPAESATQDPVAMLRRTASLYSAMRSMQADFEMVTRNPLLNSTARSRGRLYQRRPDRILLQFSDPRGDILLGDGEHFWVYYPSVDAKQVTRTSAANGAGVVDLQAQFIGDPLTRFDHKVEGREPVGGRDALAITLVPKADPGYKVLKIWIDAADGLVRRFEVTDNNDIVRRLDLADLTINPTLDDALFRFTPPEGVRIVDRG